MNIFEINLPALQAVTPKLIGIQIGWAQHALDKQMLAFDEQATLLVQVSKSEHKTDGAQNVWFVNGIWYA